MLANFAENMGHVAVNALAVIGGAFFLAFLTSFLVSFAVKRFFGKTVPPPVKTLIRIPAGILGALLVAMMLSNGSGGWGFGGRGPGSGGATTSEPNGVTATKTPEAPPKVEVPPPSRADRVRVIMVGGAGQKGDAFCRVEGEKGDLTLAKMQEYLRRRLQAVPSPSGLDILIYEKGSISYIDRRVGELKDWASKNGLNPTVIELPGELPPS